ncbi:MAG TPA: flavodoxin domain-containing protein [Gaiellaceae bacterium]
MNSLASRPEEDVVKTLVVYDSLYGNTARLAEAIGAAAGEAEVLRIGEANPSELGSFDLAIVGAPTQGGRATEAMKVFLDQIPALDGVKVAVFDTRLRARWVKVFGYAAGKITEKMKSLGAELVAEPEGFIVEGKKGPLAEGELERGAAWAESLIR